GMGIAARHLTISTCGLPEGIVRLAGEGQQWQLTVSLHAVRDELRDRLMPINRRYPLAALREACLEYSARTGRRITFAYVVIAGVNDGVADASGLVSFCRGMLAHVNLIPWNPVPGVAFRPPSPAELERFRRRLTAAGLNATVRRTRGAEFNAACGQLRAERLEGAT
ncbi:MAG: 23S rRNA (adenine(2503)-C(2))-methyltransferase RlmN, partial [Firmicutes bacterium]|nr:23S rRNA (adenine(2503)-C(2))-methyltransferase RlmN [Bacillota bacterium]